MTNPQREDGHLDIANEIVDQLCKYRIPGQEWQMIWVILRKTWCWAVKDKAGNHVRNKDGWILKKKSDWIALRQFKKMTGIPRSKCCVLLKSLENKKIIKKHVTQKGNRKAVSYGFNKNYEEWKVLPKRVTEVRVLPKRVTGVLPKRGPTKEILTKEISRQTPKPEFFDLVNLLIEKMKKNDPGAKVPKAEAQREKWANDFRLLIETDGRPIDEVKEVLAWSQEDSFWKGNILSASKFREKYPQLKLRMEDVQKKPGSQKVPSREEFNKIQEEALKRR